MSSNFPGSSGRRGRYTSRACNECRRRRCRCDGAHPTCGSCSFYGHECSWGDNDVRRPPTKQLVESLRVKIQVLEDELARLQSTNEHQGYQMMDVPDPSGLISAVDESSFPTQTHLTVPIVSPESGDHAQQSPWLAYQTEHALETGAAKTGKLLDFTYQFIFNIDDSIPPSQQSEAVRQSLNCDWSRHLPMLNDIELTRLEHDTLLDKCFRYSTCWLMSIVPQLFLYDMLRALAFRGMNVEVHHYSPLLHCSLLAYATAFSDNPLIRQQKVREVFAERVKHLLKDELGRPSLSTVQALALISEYHCGIGEKERGYMYMGMSIRAVRALNLGKNIRRSGQFQSTAISDWYFWSIYSQDKIMSLENNRDYDLRSGDYNLRLPWIDWDIDCSRWFSISGLSPVAGLDQTVRLTQVFSESCKLMVIAETIVRLHGRSSSVVDASQAVDIHWKLESWLNNLPSELLILDDFSPMPLPHVIVMNLCHWWLVLRLHQLFYHQAKDGNAPLFDTPRPFGDLSNVLCERAACKIILLVDLYHRWHGLRFFPRNMVQVILAVGTLLLKQQSTTTEGVSISWYDTQSVIKDCVTSLRVIANTWQFAEKHVAQLEGLLQAQNRPTVVATHPAPDDTSWPVTSQDQQGHDMSLFHEPHDVPNARSNF